MAVVHGEMSGLRRSRGVDRPVIVTHIDFILRSELPASLERLSIPMWRLSSRCGGGSRKTFSVEDTMSEDMEYCLSSFKSVYSAAIEPE
jgi:hypothetical protein